jgi:ribosome-associated toxin RatA of RatAB toxin-antitoxin module
LHWQVSVATVPRTFTTRVEVLRDERIVRWEATKGLVHRGQAEFTAVDAGHTLVDFQLEFEPEGALEKAGDSLGLVGNRMRADVQNYADYVESQGEATKGRNPVADSLDLDDPSKTPSEQISNRLAR